LFAQQETGKKLGLQVDKTRLDLNSIPAYVVCLKAFSDCPTDLKIWDFTLKHVSISAFVSGDLESLLRDSPFRILNANRTTAIITATLDDWLWFVVLKPCEFAEEMYKQFIFGGFTPFFQDYIVKEPFRLWKRN
jgi:hypothetical protein